MAKKKIRKVSKKSGTKLVKYDSTTFLLFLVFVLVVSMLLVASLFKTN